MENNLSFEEIPNFPERDDPAGFLLRLAKSLHAYGVPAYEIESTLTRVAKRLKLGVQCLALPTSMTMTIYDKKEVYTYVIRVAPGEVNLSKLIKVNEIASLVLSGVIPVDKGAAKLKLLETSKPIFSEWLVALSFGIMGAVIAIVFGGSGNDVLGALSCGLAVGLMGTVATRFVGGMHVFPAIAAIVTAVMAHAFAVYLPLTSIYVPIIGGLIVLLPGFSLTIAMAELSTQHLVSGTSRLFAAGINFLQMGFGVAIGSQLGLILLGSPLPFESVINPAWYQWAAILFGGLALTILFQSSLKYAPVIIIACFVSYSTSAYFSKSLGMVLGAFLGALAISIVSNLHARINNIPNSVMLVPGILLLVPGSVGFRSLTAMLDRDVVGSVETAFSMVLAGISLVMGLLIGNMLSAPSHTIISTRSS
jgi:uncharacterized membrane protein YjjP (DUF1212 family)